MEASAREEVTAPQDDSITQQDLRSSNTSLRRRTSIIKTDEENVHTKTGVNGWLGHSRRLTRRSMILSWSLNDGDISYGDKEELIEEEVKLLPLLPLDTFSFIAASRVNSMPFWVGMGVFMMQVLVHSLLLLDIQKSIEFPPNVNTEVRACQLLGLIINVVLETDISKSLNVIFKGYDEAAVIRSFGKRPIPKFLWFLSIL